VLSREELDKLLAQPQKLLVIDVRRPDEVSHIGGLPVYLSIQLGDLEKSLAWIPKGRSIITVSNHAKRAGTAADLLASRGFKVAGAVGVQTYEEAGGTLTKVAPPAPRASNASPNG
jgi:rhodanese-related sulfurtransferase